MSSGPAALLREALRRSGLSARQLARRSGIGEGRISDYLNGRHDPGSGQLMRLLEAAGAQLELAPDREGNGILLAELMNLADAIAVDPGRPRQKPRLPTFHELVGSRA